MEFYVVSPNALNDGQSEKYLKIMREENLVFMGYDDGHGLGRMFAEAALGDCVIVAQGANWKKHVSFAGLIASPSKSYDKDGVNIGQCRKLEHVVDLQECKDLFSTECSMGETRNPKAIYKLHRDNLADLRIIQTVQAKMKTTEIIKLLQTNKNLVLTGAPGTGKTYLSKQLAADLIGCQIESVNDSEQFEFVQFHPNYDYSDFVEGLKPMLVGGQMLFQPTEGTFTRFCNKAGVAPKEKPFVFVIDEINRSDLSRVFGELFFGLEPDYRGQKIETQYFYLTGKAFVIPENVYVIGTMNDIDRSVESMDFALRRRFAWREISALDSEDIIDAAKGLSPELKTKAKSRMRALNTKIADLAVLGTAYQIGGAYFKKLEKYLNDEDPFLSLWMNHISVLLKEYLRGMPESNRLLLEMKDAYGL